MSIQPATINSHPSTVRETDSETLELLEFHLIRQQLARYTTLAPARESAHALTPSSDLDRIRHRQQGHPGSPQLPR